MIDDCYKGLSIKFIKKIFKKYYIEKGFLIILKMMIVIIVRNQLEQFK